MAERDREPRRIALGYGRTRVAFDVDPARFDLLEPEHAAAPPLSDLELAARLDAPIGSPRLEEIVRAGERVCIVVPDATRASGSDRVTALLLDRLWAIGVRDADVTVLVGGGTHRPPTPEEVVRVAGADAVSSVEIAAHSAYDAAALVEIGTTTRGTPVEVNRRLVEADRTILVGAIGFHYFAGFSGGRKAFLPGCASDRAIQRNHLLAFDRAALGRAAGVESGRLDGNPVSDDMEEAARMFGPSYLVNTVLDGENRVTHCYAGDWLAAHRSGCREYLGAHSVVAPSRRPVVIVSCGGAPRDVNLIQSHKALEHARVVLEDGGDLVLLAQCAEGLGRPDFLTWFPEGGSLATARLLVDDYKVNGQTAWAIRWKSERYRVRLVSALDPEVVVRMGMIPHASLDEAVAASGDGPGYVIPNGLATLPRLAEASGAGR